MAAWIGWPEKAFTDKKSFVIGVLGEEAFVQAFEKVPKTIVDQTTKLERNIIVNKISDINEAKGCQVLFIGASEKERLPEIVKFCERSSILTIAEIEGFTEKDGGIIQIGGQVKISPSAAGKARLKIPAKLLDACK